MAPRRTRQFNAPNRSEIRAVISPPGEVVKIVNLEDPKGRAAFDKLSHAEREHLRLFGLSRPGWDLAIHGTLTKDEKARASLDTEDPSRSQPLHWYQTGTLYTLGKVRAMPRHGMQLLDVGSPIEQVLALCALDGVTVSVVDIRPRWYPDLLPFTSITGTASHLPVADNTVDVVTSNCVLCHVGDGRYGTDTLDVDGDLKMLRECKRVLRPGGTLVIGIGPMWHRAHILFNWHRVYSQEWADKLFRWAGLRLMDFLAYNGETGVWHTPDLMDKTTKKVMTYYGFATLEKPCLP